MNTLKVYNPPFNVNFSSCSDKVPKKFRWTNEESDNGTVFIDRDILSGVHLSVFKKYAWIAESPEIVPDVIQYVKKNADLISNCYAALFTCVEELVGYRKNFYYCPNASNIPWSYEYKIHAKNKICSMFASSKNFTTGHKYREFVAKKFAGNIDLYGGMLGSKYVGGISHMDKSIGINSYMFSIVIENAKVDKYYTEKITDCFATGTIPIYWGTDKIAEDFNPDGIIRLTDDFDVKSLSKDLYISKINYVIDNYNKVCDMKMADDCLYDLIVKLNER
jgi:hypothetical protein